MRTELQTGRDMGKDSPDLDVLLHKQRNISIFSILFYSKLIHKIKYFDLQCFSPSSSKICTILSIGIHTYTSFFIKFA
jgi:hypothetical protein